MVTGIIGRKVGMTQIFDPDGMVHPATVIKGGPCVVVQAKGAQRDGYEAVQLGLVEERPAKARKPLAGPLQEGWRASDTCPPRGKAGGGRRRAEDGRAGARLDFRQRRARGRHRPGPGQGFSGGGQAPSFRRRGGDPRVDVPPCARLDWRLVVSIPCHQGDARGRADGRRSRDDSQPRRCCASIPTITC